MAPVIDLTIHSDDSALWYFTPRTDAAKAWAQSIGVPPWAWENVGYFAASGVTFTFDEILASARAAGLVLSFTSSHEPMAFGLA